MKLQRLAILAAMPLLLAGCTIQKDATNILYAGSQTKIVQLARDLGDQVAAVPLIETPHYGEGQQLAYYIAFKENAPLSAFSLSGGLAGMTIDKVTLIDEHGVYVHISGKASDPSATDGFINFTPDAYTAIDKEYEGFTFHTTVLLGDETTLVDR